MELIGALAVVMLLLWMFNSDEKKEEETPPTCTNCGHNTNVHRPTGQCAELVDTVTRKELESSNGEWVPTRREWLPCSCSQYEGPPLSKDAAIPSQQEGERLRAERESGR